MQPAIISESLTKAYGSLLAVDDVSFTADPGKVTGLLGPNGAGKTTLIRVLTSVVRPTSGTFQVAGTSDPLEIRGRVGVLPESFGYPKRTAAIDYLLYNARLYGLSKSAALARAGSLLEQVGLTERAGDPIGTFSRGMRQRLGLARALVNEPEVLFLDEPTLGLDPAGKRDVLDLIVALKVAGAAIVLTSHLLDEIERVCDHIVILDNGRVALDRRTEGEEARLVTIGVEPDDLDRALEVVGELGLIAQKTSDRELRVSVARGERAGLAVLLSGLVNAGVVLERFDANGSRLTETFLEATR
ncbi:MAG: ABC transporter ATP-binding protein [Acidimicrobiia bacterium]|nr:ABC transporter ATP-binding protein [Acidimicrobiia bacterium]